VKEEVKKRNELVFVKLAMLADVNLKMGGQAHSLFSFALAAPPSLAIESEVERYMEAPTFRTASAKLDPCPWH
jgi:hypothetical protein